MQLVKFVILSFFVAGYAYSWSGKITDQRVVPNLGHYYQYTFTTSKKFPVYAHIALLNSRRYQASLVVQKRNDAKSLMDLSLNEGAEIAVNGGYYREKFQPNGLLILKGQRKSRFVSNTLLAAIIEIDKSGQLKLLTKKESYKGAYDAFQAGPILVQNNQKYQKGSATLRQRSVLVEFSNGEMAVVSLSPVTLNDAADIIDKLAGLMHKKIKLAVNLDGGVASAFIINFDKSPVIIPERADVKMALLFKGKK